MKVFTDVNFDVEVLEADRPVLVEFSASWCGPCKSMALVLDKISEQYVGQLEVGSIDIEDHADLAMKYGVMNVPTVMIFKKGRIVEKKAGLCNQKELEKMIGRAL